MQNIATINTDLIDKHEVFSQLINLIPYAIVIANKEGKITYFNSQTQEMFGYKLSDLTGQMVEVLIPKRFQEKHIEYRENYFRCPAKRAMESNLELFGIRKDGSEFPVDIMLAPAIIDNCEQVISVIHNVTAAKQQARQLEDTVSALTHDLKTPLLAAETNLNLILEGYFGSLTDEQKRILQLLSKSNNDALRLVKNLLSVFKYETKSYKLLLEPVKISFLFGKVNFSIKPILEEKNISLKIFSSDFEFVCDSFEIERVIVNLLTNAVKYSGTGGEIILRAIKDEDGNVTVVVEDSGSGIAGDDMQNLFKRFWQSKRTSSRSNSTGLGLYLSRKIVEAHGGKIWAESELNSGTKVTFKIPSLVA